MSISSINYASSLLGMSIQNINNQLSDLSAQLSTGVKSQNYAGMGVNEGFAIAARAQLANIAAYGNTMTNVNTIISGANTALQSLYKITGNVQDEAAQTPQDINSSGQTVGQQSAAAQLGAMVGILNTQIGNRYIFSGTAINTPPVTSADVLLNGTTTQAGLKQVIAERQQADLGTDGLGHLAITSPTTTSVQVAEDAAGSPFGLKLDSVSSSLNGATVTGPGGSPAGVSIDLTTATPNPGDQITFTFDLPDGTTESVKLTASSDSPPPAGSFTIGTTPDETATNLKAALNTAIGTVANTSLVAASAVAAGDNFFNTAGTATGGAVTNQATPPAAITGATALSGAPGSDSISPGFAQGDTITVDGQTIKFVASGATGPNEVNVTDSIQTLLGKIDGITGTTTPSTVHGGVITLHTDDAASLSVSSSNSTAFAALGFSGTATAAQPPLRVGGSPPTLVNGSADTVSWYNGNSGPGSARSTAVARIDQSQTVQYGAQANEQALRSALEQVAVYAAVTASPTGTNSKAQIAALSERIGTNLTSQPGQQTIQDIETEFATASTSIKDAQARQTDTQTAMQNMIDDTESVSPDEVASKLLALQNSLQASYQVTSMLSQLSLTKFLPIG